MKKQQEEMLLTQQSKGDQFNESKSRRSFKIKFLKMKTQSTLKLENHLDL